jgi:sugar O-acyltransferase (sialic acid O-acetyltransferase NeuD family)
MSLPVIIIGAGGHAKVLISVLRPLKVNVLGMTDVAPNQSVNGFEGIPVLGTDDKIFERPPDSVLLANGIGSISLMEKRKDIYIYFKNNGYSFAKVIHTSAIIMGDVQLGEGVQIMAGAIVQPGCVIGDNSIINTGAIVDHDCVIGEHVHVAPGAVISGGVHIGAMTHIGTSASIIQGLNIGENTLIGAGAVVIKDIPSGVKAQGIPAKIIEGRK